MECSSRNLFLLFVVLLLLSSQVAPSNAQTTDPVIGSRRPFCSGSRYSSCIARPPPLKRRKCNYANLCKPPPAGKAGGFTIAQYKDDFHN